MKRRESILIVQYFEHILHDNVLLSCSILMLVLFSIDLFGLLATRFRFARCRHISFSTTIVSMGLFATFVGVLIGLYGFDSSNIAASVPKLLEGLRFAFAGSVLGMFLSLLLSIAGKLFSGAVEDEEVLHSIDEKMGAIVTALQEPGELVRQFDDMKLFLKDQLERINISLDRALTELAKGATQEVIEALEKIITDFNQNLTAQFGDNFKELNSACHKLITWQQKYKKHIESSEQSLKQIMQSLDQSCTAASELTKSNEKTQKVCQEVGTLIKTYDVQIQTLENHLSSCKELGKQASTFLTSTQEAITHSTDNLNNFSGVIQESVGKQSKSLLRLTDDIEQQLPKALGELERMLTAITNQFAQDYRSLFEYVTKKQ